MKANRLVFSLLLLLNAAVFQLRAQQAEENRKQFVKTRSKAEKGDAQAQLDVALMLSMGQGAPFNPDEAVIWVHKAAMNGNAVAQNFLGVLYQTGASVAQDFTNACKWFRTSAETGFAVARYNLGRMYELGTGVAQDSTEADKWFHLAAGQGEAMAQNGLGLKSEINRDFGQAAKWYRKSADQGFDQAQFNLGTLFAKGLGVTRDYEESVKWFRKAANQGDARAQGSIGYLYVIGQGVPQDYIEAYKWFNLAAARGDTNAVVIRDGLNQKLTREQIAEGQRRAAAFVARKEATDTKETLTELIPIKPAASGTGFFITTDGFLITSEHVVREAARVRLLTSAGLISASVVKVDAANDLALLKAEGRFAVLPVAASRAVKLGGTVATVGFPSLGLQGFAPKLAKGEIASLSGAGDDARYFQISVPVQPGNSGGALVDEQGNVVGVVSAKLSARAALAASGALPENVNYAVKSSFLLGFLESVPEVSAKLKEPKSLQTAIPKFEDVVKSVEQAAVVVLVY